MNSFHCGSSDSGSYVDLLTNTMMLSEIDLKKHLGDLLQSKMPERTLPSFLHEAAHFWCFQSPIGNTLAHLRLRAARTIKYLQDRTDDDARFAILEDVVRYETTMEMLRPIAEGLACFAEFDATPGTSNVASGPMLWTSQLYEGREGMRDRGFNLFLFELLTRMRVDREVVRRKENLLASHFEFERSGHLAGYMTVKMLWNSAILRTNRAPDRDHFFSFLKSYFYDDHAFVATVLDPNVSEHEAGNQIGLYFQDRIRRFLTMDIDAAMEEYEEAITDGLEQRTTAKGNIVAFPNFKGLSVDPALEEQGKQLTMRLIDELDLQYQENGNLSVELDRKISFQRHTMCIGSTDVWIRVNEHDRALIYQEKPQDWHDGIMGSYNVFEGTEQYEGPARVEFKYFTSLGQTATILWKDDKAIALVTLGKTDEYIEASLPYSIERSALLKEVENMDALLNDHIEGDEILKLMINGLTASLPEGVASMYARLASMICEDSVGWEQFERTLVEGGLYSVLESDAELIRGLALAGNAASVKILDEELAEIFEEQNLDFPRFMERADSLGKKLKVPVAANIEGQIFTVV